MFVRGSLRQGSVRLGNCSFGEMSIVEVSVGEVSAVNLSLGSVSWVKCPVGGNVRTPFFKNCIFFPKYCKYNIAPGVSYGTWNSLSVTLFANNMIILLRRSGDKKQFILGCKRELVLLAT